MNNKKYLLMPFITGILIVIATAVWLGTAQPVSAQCGSQASSCKDCHETQGQDPVNADGTGWHQSHAFGDFCYMCHVGNSQAPEKDAAHTGMVAPMADIKGSCSSCHVKDYTEKAQVYATTLGIDLAGAAPTAAPTTAPTVAAPATTSGAATDPAASAEVSAPKEVNPMPVIDYIEQYAQAQAAKQKTNWGGIMLVVFAILLVLGAGFYLLTRIGWVKVSFAEAKQVQGEYPADVVDMLPSLAQLKPAARKSLRSVLAKPTAGEFLSSLENLLGAEKKE